MWQRYQFKMSKFWDALTCWGEEEMSKLDDSATAAPLILSLWPPPTPDTPNQNQGIFIFVILQKFAFLFERGLRWGIRKTIQRLQCSTLTWLRVVSSWFPLLARLELLLILILLIDSDPLLLLLILHNSDPDPGSDPLHWFWSFTLFLILCSCFSPFTPILILCSWFWSFTLILILHTDSRFSSHGQCSEPAWGQVGPRVGSTYRLEKIRGRLRRRQIGLFSAVQCRLGFSPAEIRIVKAPART